MKRVAMSDEEYKKFKRFICKEDCVVKALDDTLYTDAFIAEANNGVRFPKAFPNQKDEIQDEEETLEERICTLEKALSDVTDIFKIDENIFENRFNALSMRLDALERRE